VVAPEVEAPPAAELRLAGEADLSGTLTQRRPGPGAGDDATVEMPAGDSAGETLAQSRRWTDTMALEPEAAPVAAPAPPSATPRPASDSRLGLFAVIGVAVLAAAGWLAWQYYESSTGLAVVADDAGAEADGSADAGAAAPPPAPREMATPTKKLRRKLAPAPRTELAEDTEVAWYDQPALPAAGAGAETGAAAATPDPVIQITRSPVTDPVYDRLTAAYAALQAGDAVTAEAAYREVLAADDGNVDALLGLATLAGRAGRGTEARDLFRRVQQLDPKNATAAAALSALPGQGGDAAGASAGQLKSMLAEQPESAELHFALGLRYVADQRWPDAQVEFFEAVRYAPRNADYAYNLAVSLDRLGQDQPAASYYQRALDLAAGSQQFDVAAAQARLATLRGPGG
jgi:Tfp pilus assembly protein PilF